jgi:hypothetical protein
MHKHTTDRTHANDDDDDDNPEVRQGEKFAEERLRKYQRSLRQVWLACAHRNVCVCPCLVLCQCDSCLRLNISLYFALLDRAPVRRAFMRMVFGTHIRVLSARFPSGTHILHVLLCLGVSVRVRVCLGVSVRVCSLTCKIVICEYPYVHIYTYACIYAYMYTIPGHEEPF